MSSNENYENEAKEVVEKFSGLEPSVEALPDSVVVRNDNGDIIGVYVRSTVPDAASIDGAIAFRVSAADERIQFCDNEAAIREFLATPKVTRGPVAPTNPAKDDIWIEE